MERLDRQQTICSNQSNKRSSLFSLFGLTWMTIPSTWRETPTSPEKTSKTGAESSWRSPENSGKCAEVKVGPLWPFSRVCSRCIPHQRPALPRRWAPPCLPAAPTLQRGRCSQSERREPAPDVGPAAFRIKPTLHIYLVNMVQGGLILLFKTEILLCLHIIFVFIIILLL